MDNKTSIVNVVSNVNSVAKVIEECRLLQIDDSCDYKYLVEQLSKINSYMNKIREIKNLYLKKLGLSITDVPPTLGPYEYKFAVLEYEACKLIKLESKIKKKIITKSNLNEIFIDH
jgi:hypothetical protein